MDLNGDVKEFLLTGISSCVMAQTGLTPPPPITLLTCLDHDFVRDPESNLISQTHIIK